MDLGLTNKTAIIVGGSSNIGRACSIAFAQEGANVVIAARNENDCQKVADQCNDFKTGGTAIAIPTDATVLNQCKELVRKTLKKFQRIDTLIISMGWNKLAYFLELDQEDWSTIITTNYVSTLTILKAVLPVMINQKGGNVVTISSVLGRKGDPHESVYAGCKAAQINLTHSLALDMAKHNIRLNIVAPALTMPDSSDEIGGDSLWSSTVKGALSDEDRVRFRQEFEANTPLGTLAKSRDVANAALFFASDLMAGHVTGNLIGTDGGMYMTR